jgi:hypothetical protein
MEKLVYSYSLSPDPVFQPADEPALYVPKLPSYPTFPRIFQKLPGPLRSGLIATKSVDVNILWINLCFVISIREASWACGSVVERPLCIIAIWPIQCLRKVQVSITCPSTFLRICSSFYTRWRLWLGFGGAEEPGGAMGRFLHFLWRASELATWFGWL